MSDEVTDVVADVVDGSFLGEAHPVFHLCEGLFDWVEVGRVRRQVPKPRADGADGCADGRRFVAAQMIHDDDVAGRECRHELLFDIGAEAVAVDWPVEDARRGEPLVAQGAEEGQRPPMGMRGERPQALTFEAPATQRRHVGLDPRLVDEDETFGIETPLQSPPSRAATGDILTPLFEGEQGFF